MKFKNIIEKAMKIQGFTNQERQLVPALRMSKATFYTMKTGKTPLQEEQALLLSQMTGYGPAQIVAIWNAEFSKSKAMREAWQQFARVASVAALSLAVVAGTAFYSPTLGEGTSVVCILCSIACYAVWWATCGNDDKVLPA